MKILAWKYDFICIVLEICMYVYRLLNVFVSGTPFANLQYLCYEFEPDVY